MGRKDFKVKPAWGRRGKRSNRFFMIMQTRTFKKKRRPVTLIWSEYRAARPLFSAYMQPVHKGTNV